MSEKTKQHLEPHWCSGPDSSRIVLPFEHHDPNCVHRVAVLRVAAPTETGHWARLNKALDEQVRVRFDGLLAVVALSSHQVLLDFGAPTRVRAYVLLMALALMARRAFHRA